MLRLAALTVCALVPFVLSVPATRAGDGALPVAQPNDNRRPAGRLRRDTLFVDLELRMGRWYPEAADGPFVEAPMLAERGRRPQVPGPLLRVPEGTVIVARLANALADSTVTWRGLVTRPGRDSVRLRPGESTTLRFTAGRPGTYLYGAQAGQVDRREREREQAIGAFVVDVKGAPTDDRIFVMNAWGEPLDSVLYSEALTINGRSWPHTERLRTTRGTVQRWRVVNGTTRAHPMHLHGFYYRLLARGDGARDSSFAPGAVPLVVTETLGSFETMALDWVPERAGNWLFHCHLTFHVTPEVRLEPAKASHADHLSGDMSRHMAGLVLGIEVRDTAPSTPEDRTGTRTLRLLVQEGVRRGRAPRAIGPVLQEGAEPAPDSAGVPGSTLVLTRGEPTDIRIVNRLAEPTAIHWHGIELESWSDGVPGWSGAMNRLAPAVAPGDSFTARLTLPRAGTFIYHTHLNDVEQLTSGLYGAIVVLEPGQVRDPRTDHLFVLGRDGAANPGKLLVNGDSLPPPLVLDAGVEHRLRFVFIQPAGGSRVRLLSDTTLVTWRALARDGAELPAARQVTQPATVRVWAGQTFDFGFKMPEGDYRLVVGDPKQPQWERKVVVVNR
ncbi:MAG TPA: multicopper oxidase domain-containing protein [Gemmatimonadales bacterium]|nr:multicopper oxidase domain-containing protein [Gemmatimonadales bacterium]